VLISNATAGELWGTWRGLNAQSTFDLAYTTVENGGSAGVQGAGLSVRAEAAADRAAIPVLKVDHVTIASSAGTGLVLEGAAGFTADSDALVVKGSGGAAAIDIGPLAAGTLPALTATGNARDVIRILGGALYISADLTLKDRGVPYYFVFDRVRVTDPVGERTPTLTIEPGVAVQFDDYLEVGFVNPGVSNQPGRLIAVGTAEKPIVFTSSKAAPAPGDWPGIWLLNASGSRLEHVNIDFAGGRNGIVSSNCKPAKTTDNAALFIGSKDHTYVPAASDFVAVGINNSAQHGINAMWQTSGDFLPDLTGAFTFAGINGCRQTKNATTKGCPGGEGCAVP
jgi:hypothetical protein